MCRHFEEDYGLEVRIVRLHNVYGPKGTYSGGREKAPAALCRKIAQAKIMENEEITVWGDGKQTRSFMYIDDCVTGILKVFSSKFSKPINLGSSEQVSINHMIKLIEKISNIKTKKKIFDAQAKGSKRKIK